jgi:hypothetical protein
MMQKGEADHTVKRAVPTLNWMRTHGATKKTKARQQAGFGKPVVRFEETDERQRALNDQCRDITHRIYFGIFRGLLTCVHGSAEQVNPSLQRIVSKSFLTVEISLWHEIKIVSLIARDNIAH